MKRCIICDGLVADAGMCARCRRSYRDITRRKSTLMEMLAWAATRARNEELRREICRQRDRET